MTAWLGVVSYAHVRTGVAGGFAQLCHGKAQPLRRGHLSLEAADFATIAAAMGVRPANGFGAGRE
jgi:hypothetical protein